MTQDQLQALPGGTKIAVYEIQEVIHQDTASITYRAWNRHLNATVAIAEYAPNIHAERQADKINVAPKSAADKKLFDAGLAIFIQQHETLLGIQHPGVIETHNVLHFNGTAYCVMDDNKGILLSQWFATSTATSEAELTGLLHALLETLQHLHENGTVHGDLHANNIFISSDNAPVLINFAATRLADAAMNGTLTQELRCGYAAAELYLGDNPANEVSDIYALGALMYAGITQIEPVSALVRNEAVNNNQADPLQPCADLKLAEYDSNLLATIDAMLSLEESERPQSAQQVLLILNDNIADSQTTSVGNKEGDSKVYSALYQRSLWGVVLLLLVIVGMFFWPEQSEEQAIIASQSPDTVANKPLGSDLDSQAEDQQTLVLAENSGAQSGNKISAEIIEESVSAAQLEKSSKIDIEPVMKEIEYPPHSVTVLPPSKEPGTEEAIDTQTEIQVPSREIETDNLIKQHLSSAEDAIVAFKFSTPVADNAHYHYLEILKIQPDNVAAQAGLKNLVKIYAWLIDDAINKQRLQLARIYLERAEKIIPDSEDLVRFYTLLN